ncbi:MAG: hypothetical protein WCI76_02865, partial [bacterium]
KFFHFLILQVFGFKGKSACTSAKHWRLEQTKRKGMFFMSNPNDRITVFFGPGGGRPIGTCPKGHESEWINHGSEKGISPQQVSRQISSTEGRWQAYAKRSVTDWEGAVNEL